MLRVRFFMAIHPFLNVCTPEQSTAATERMKGTSFAMAKPFTEKARGSKPKGLTCHSRMSEDASARAARTPPVMSCFQGKRLF